VWQPQPRSLPAYIAQDRLGVTKVAPLSAPAPAPSFKEATLPSASSSSLFFRQRVETGAMGVHRVTIPSTVEVRCADEATASIQAPSLDDFVRRQKSERWRQSMRSRSWFHGSCVDVCETCVRHE
jgi:hypothetical protein